MPMTPGAVLVGRSVADMFQSVAGPTVMVAIGRRGHGGLTASAGSVGLRFAAPWVDIHLAALAGRPELVQAVQIPARPAAFRSDAIASPASMPARLGATAEWNPMSATATAVRGLFGSPGTTGDSWAATHAELPAVAWPVALVAVILPPAVRGLSRWAVP